MKKILFTQDWEFTRVADNSTELINLPHDATISEDRDPNIRIGYLCAFYHGGKYEYKKKFTLEDEWKGKAIYIDFEGIYRNFQIYVNGNEIASQVNGYVGVCKRIDKYLTDSENEIKVCIDTPFTDHSRWYAGSGIYRDVFLYVGDECHILPNGIKVTTLSLNPTKVNIKTSASKECDGAEITVYDGHNVIAKSVGLDSEVEIPNAKFWSDETPYLYEVEVAIKKDGKVCDLQKINTGIRILSQSADKGFMINGKRTILRGGCIHCDNGVLGVVTTRQTELRRAKKIKAAGFNAIRSAHHLISPALLEACDEVGLLVMDEAFDSWYRMKTLHDFSCAFYDEYRMVLNAMVEKDYNHPSVIMYSIGNEIPEIGSLKGIRYGKEMIKIIKAQDVTRPVVLCPSMRLAKDFLSGMPYDKIDEDEFLKSEENRKIDFEHYVKVWTRGLANVLSVFEYTKERKNLDEVATCELYNELDIAGYNYYGEYYEDLHAIHPERVILGTETEGNKLSYHFEKAKKYPYVIGDFVWTLQDHLGECNCAELRYEEEKSDKNYPWINNWCGKLDLLGNENITAFKYRLAWGIEKGIRFGAQVPVHDGIEARFNNDRETDCIESWSFAGCEGNKTYIDVVTDAPEAEVFINGRSIGKKTTNDYTARFFTEYEKGELKAVGYSADGVKLYEKILNTAGDETVITTYPEKQILKANGQDLCFIPIEITDGKGTVKSYPERKIKVDVEGAACLAALGSAAYKTEEKYTDGNFTTFEGKLLAVIRSNGKIGDVTVKLSGEGLDEKQIKLKVSK